MIASASPIYKALFVRPGQSLWLGTRELLRLVVGGRLGREPLTPEGGAALHHITSIRNYIITDADTDEILTKAHTIQVTVDRASNELCFETPSALVEKVRRSL